MEYFSEINNAYRYNTCYRSKIYTIEKEFNIFVMQKHCGTTVFYYLDGQLHNRFGRALIYYNKLGEYGYHRLFGENVSYSQWTRYPIILPNEK